jgi:DNA-binding response OmpR family regulator
MTGKRILIIDDDLDIINIYKACFKGTEFVIETAGNGSQGLEMVRSFSPDLIILDIMMPEMNGYGFCSNLRIRDGEVSIPIILASAEEENDMANAFYFGVVDYLVKPFRKEELMESVKRNIGTKKRWDSFLKSLNGAQNVHGNAGIRYFLEFFAGKLDMKPEERGLLLSSDTSSPYALAQRLKLESSYIARSLAEFYQMPYIPVIDPESIVLGILPVSFLQNKNVVVVQDSGGNLNFVTAEPYDAGLMDLLKSAADYPFAVTEPENISQLFDKAADNSGVLVESRIVNEAKLLNRLDGAGMTKLSNQLLAKAIMLKTDDLSFVLEDVWADVLIGSNKFYRITARGAAMSVLRYKMLAGLDLGENQTPQNGGFQLIFRGAKYKLRVSTTPTPFGETCSVRIEK